MALKGRHVLRSVLAVLGVVLSVVLIASVFFRIGWADGLVLTPRFQLGRFLRELPENAAWLTPFAVLSASIIPLRALQWQATLAKKVPYRERYHLVGIGAFVHNAIPGKLGDIFRSFLMSRTEGLPFVSALGSVAVCKLLEFAALMLLVAASFLGPSAGKLTGLAPAMRVAVGVCLALVALVVLLARFSEPLAHALRRRERFPRLQMFLLHTSKGLGTARSARGMFTALVLSVPPVLAPAVAYGLALEAIGVRGGIFAGPVVLGAIALGQATPGVPAGTGIYLFVSSLVARTLGASADDAAAFALLTNVGTVVSQVAVGGTSVLIRRIRWADLRRGAGEAAQAARHVDEAEGEPAHA